jgi:hypothetical protein
MRTNLSIIAVAALIATANATIATAQTVAAPRLTPSERLWLDDVKQKLAAASIPYDESGCYAYRKGAVLTLWCSDDKAAAGKAAVKGLKGPALPKKID